ncbi:MAG TPA: helix-turn-helix domain-containing protein [Myxococcales bacterium]|jgi:excisionase family DNA binding protein
MSKIQDAHALAVDGLATLRESGAFLSLSRSGLYKLLRSGELPSVKVGKARRIPRAALAAFVEQRVAAGLK